MFNYQRFFFSTKRQIEAHYGIYEVDEKVDLISGLKKLYIKILQKHQAAVENKEFHWYITQCC